MKRAFRFGLPSSRLATSLLATVALASTLVAACGSERDGFGENGTSATDPGKSGTFDPTDGAAPDANYTPPVLGTLKGKVVAPEGTIPIRNALVYLTSSPPPAIPDGVHCDTCVKLTPFDGYAYSGSDGTFDLPVYKTGHQYLVTQKGQFRRVREIEVANGDQQAPFAYTQLPSKTDPANSDTIPKIALAVGGYDHIDQSLKALGIEEFFRYGDAPFDLPFVPPPIGIKTGKSMQALTEDTTELGKYHLLLMPCGSLAASNNETSGWSCSGPTASQKTTLQSFVDAGGKVYVTDFAYEAVRQTWPGFISWYDDGMKALPDTGKVGEGCRDGADSSAGKVEDKGLDEWLSTIGHSSVELHASWTRLAGVKAQPGVDPEGKPTTITPKVWMTANVAGQQLPATVSFEQKCGRVLFSTYHCEGDQGDGALLPQEKALLYILLEVGVCVGEMPPPPGPK